MKPRLPEKPQLKWVLLSFRLPRVPSTPRIAVWRKLKRLGVAQLLDGLVALPANNRNREQLEWIAGEVSEAGGEALVWIGQLTTVTQEHDLVLRMQRAVATDYLRLIDEVGSVSAQPATRQRRSLGRLRRELRRIRGRDHFPPSEREHAEQAIDELARTIEDVLA
jgi:CelD/BcsL family acetyltransferase involved in cellulose biosynthesis